MSKPAAPYESIVRLTGRFELSGIYNGRDRAERRADCRRCVVEDRRDVRGGVAENRPDKVTNYVVCYQSNALIEAIYRVTHNRAPVLVHALQPGGTHSPLRGEGERGQQPWSRT